LVSYPSLSQLVFQANQHSLTPLEYYQFQPYYGILNVAFRD